MVWSNVDAPDGFTLSSITLSHLPEIEIESWLEPPASQVRGNALLDGQETHRPWTPI